MIVAALEGLERGMDPGLSGDGPPGVRRTETTETAETLARLYTEVLGLIPFELAPAVPGAESRQRLMAAITGERIAQTPAPVGPPQPGAAPVPAPLPESAPPAQSSPAQSSPAQPLPAAPVAVFAPPPEPAPAPPPVQGDDAQPSASVRRQPPRPVPLSSRRSYWPVALAAGLLLSLGLAGWLYTQQAEQRETIARLQSEVREARQKEAQATQEADRFRREFSTLRTTMTLVTAPAALVGPLRPVGELQPDARGAIFVAADHQHWHLSIEGLKQAPAGKAYHLWFMPEQGPPVNGGSFVAKANERVEISSEAMPPETKSCMITLEEAGGVPPRPQGPEILRAAGMVQIL